MKSEMKGVQKCIKPNLKKTKLGEGELNLHYVKTAIISFCGDGGDPKPKLLRMS